LRQDIFLNRLQLLVARSNSSGVPSTQLVSACDKFHNARSLLQDYRQHGEALWERFKGGRDGTLWYYRALVDTLRRADRLPKQLLGELEKTVSALEQESAAPGQNV